jgi:hypothetical protein
MDEQCNVQTGFFVGATIARFGAIIFGFIGLILMILGLARK